MKKGSVMKDNKSQSSECSSFKAKTCSFFSTELVKLFCNGEQNLKTSLFALRNSNLLRALPGGCHSGYIQLAFNCFKTQILHWV